MIVPGPPLFGKRTRPAPPSRRAPDPGSTPRAGDEVPIGTPVRAAYGETTRSTRRRKIPATVRTRDRDVPSRWPGGGPGDVVIGLPRWAWTELARRAVRASSEFLASP